MNLQKPPNAIEWTRVPLPDGTYTRGYTWNVMGGCLHACKWIMPDGKEAQCYAKTVAERVAQAAYPQGFEHHYFHPERLDEPSKVKEPAGIFLDSMADLMGHWVTDDQIQQVLDVCRKAHWHTFFLLTKNAPRLSKFEYPPNVWVGASSPPDYMFGKRLTRDQQEKMLHRTLKTLQEVKAKVRWISFEPLSWDCSEIVKQYPGALTWAVIGAASNGPTEYPPAERDLLNMLEVLDAQKVPIFYKGNMRTLPMTSNDWRHNFPTQEPKGYAGYEFPDYQWGCSNVFETTESIEPEPPKPKTTLVNIRDHQNVNVIYIGRQNRAFRLEGSKWANPYTIDTDTPENRLAAIEKYRVYIKAKIASGELDIEELRGKVLACWCSPKPCHGNVLLQILGEEPEPSQSQQPKAVEQPPLFDLAPITPKHYA